MLIASHEKLRVPPHVKYLFAFITIPVNIQRCIVCRVVMSVYHLPFFSAPSLRLYHSGNLTPLLIAC
jgi:hypothetical protein